MEGLLTATNMSFQPALEQLGGVLLLWSECLRQVSWLFEFPWKILMCTAVVVFIVNRLYPSRRKQELVKRASGLMEECHKLSEKIGLIRQDFEGIESRVVETSPLMLQTLSLAALNENLNRPSLEDTVDFPEQGSKSEPPKFSFHGPLMDNLQGQIRSLEDASKSLQTQVTDAKNILKSLQNNVEQLHEKLEDGLKENAYLQGSLKELAQETACWEQSLQEKKAKKERLETSNAQMNQVVNKKEMQVNSLTETVQKIISVPVPQGEDSVNDGSLELDQKSLSEKGDHLVRQSDIDVKKLIDIVNLNFCLESLYREKQEKLKKISEENQVNEEATGEIKSLQTEQASLKCENSQLENEIQKLQLTLETLPPLYQDHVRQLQKKSIEEKNHCFKIEKKLAKVHRNMSYAHEKCKLYRKIVEDLDTELERTTSFYQNKLLFYEKKAQESWLTAVATERKLSELREENNQRRKSSIQVPSFPSNPFAPAVPNATSKGQEVSGDPLDQQVPKEGETLSNEGSGIQGDIQV